MATKQQLIDSGKVWIVYPDGNPDSILHEGTKASCRKYLKDQFLRRLYKTGKIRMAKVIFETN